VLSLATEHLQLQLLEGHGGLRGVFADCCSL
jgi:hypothetical protein